MTEITSRRSLAKERTFSSSYMLSFAFKLIMSNNNDDVRAMSDVVSLIETEGANIEVLEERIIE